MIKAVVSIIVAIVFELVIFNYVIGKAYTPDTAIIITCIFLVSVAIRSQLSGVGTAALVSSNLISEGNKEEYAVRQTLETQARFLLLGVIYLIVLFYI